MKKAYVKVTVWEAADKNSLALYTFVFPQGPQQLNHIKILPSGDQQFFLKQLMMMIRSGMFDSPKNSLFPFLSLGFIHLIYL